MAVADPLSTNNSQHEQHQSDRDECNAGDPFGPLADLLAKPRAQSHA